MALRPTSRSKLQTRLQVRNEINFNHLPFKKITVVNVDFGLLFFKDNHEKTFREKLHASSIA